jgi:hypothetical protein
MTGVEALQELRDGKKVRRTRWFDGTYAINIGREVIIRRHNYTKVHGKPSVEDFFQDDWEVVE